MTFYNSHDKPIAYSENGTDIYLFNGHPVAYLSSNAVYSYNGKHLGWFEKGCIRDKKGYPFFLQKTQLAVVSSSVKSVKSVKPVKNSKQSPSIKAADSLSWSAFSNEQFFLQWVSHNKNNIKIVFPFYFNAIFIIYLNHP